HIFPTPQESHRRRIGTDQSCACTAFDGHVAHCHAAFHRQLPYGFTRIFNDMACAEFLSEFCNDRQDQIFRSHTRCHGTIHPDIHRPGFGLHQRLSREHMLDLTRTDAESKGAEGSMCGCMTVAADDCPARLGESELWPDDVDDALVWMVHIGKPDAEVGTVFSECLHLFLRNFIFDDIPVPGRNVVIHRGICQVRTPDFAVIQAQAFKSLRRSHFMDKMLIDIDQIRLIRLRMHYMIFPDFFNNCFSHIITPFPYIYELQIAFEMLLVERFSITFSAISRVPTTRPPSESRSAV